MRVGLAANPSKPLALDLARRCIDRLASRVDLVVVPETRDAVGDAARKLTGVPLGELQADALVVIGGDGTFLHWLQHTEVPVLPINAGTVGFLAEVDGKRGEAVDAALDKLVAGRYVIESRMKLASHCAGTPLPDATNEIVVHTSQVAKMRLFEIAVDDRPLGRVRADGVILATPTGSTSYSLAALGPIVDPALEAIVVGVLAPFQAIQRAVVIDPLRRVSVRLAGTEKDGVVVVDGQNESRVAGGASVLAYRSTRRASFVRFGSRFFRRLQGRRILPWSEELPDPEGDDGADLPTAA